MVVDKSVETVDKSHAAGGLPFSEAGMKRVLGVFAKEPLAGKVKTRLAPPLEAEAAAELYRVFLEETVAAMGGGEWDLVLCYAGDEAFFRGAFPGVRLLPQGEGDLGSRMERSLRTLLAEGYGTAVLIGSDTPDLPLSLVRQAFASLREVSAVVAPSHDGGYVLIGERRHTPGLFEGVPWSSSGVLAATRKRAAGEGIELGEVAAWDDVDDLASLRRLIARSPRSVSALRAAALLARGSL